MKTISISGREFEISTPYAEGHVLTAIEAHVLNQTRAENIGNNFRKAVKEAGEDAEKLSKVTAEIQAYDAAYQFTAVRRGSSPTATPLEKMALSLAKKWLVATLRDKMNMTLKAYTEAKGEEFVEAKLAEIAEQEDIQKEAKDAIKRAERTVAKPLGVSVE